MSQTDPSEILARICPFTKDGEYDRPGFEEVIGILMKRYGLQIPDLAEEYGDTYLVMERWVGSRHADDAILTIVDENDNPLLRIYGKEFGTDRELRILLDSLFHQECKTVCIYTL